MAQMKINVNKKVHAKKWIMLLKQWKQMLKKNKKTNVKKQWKQILKHKC